MTAPSYLPLLELSRKMALAAEAQHWERVAGLEAEAREQVALLKNTPPALLGPAERHARQQALLAILRHDARVRAWAEPGWQVLDQLHIL